MNDNVPLSIIRSELDGVPPIRVETTIREPCDFCPEVEPAVQEAKEPKNQEKGGWKH